MALALSETREFPAPSSRIGWEVGWKAWEVKQEGEGSLTGGAEAEERGESD